jgi:transcriptional regulator with XRE-family HTH domain
MRRHGKQTVRLRAARLRELRELRGLTQGELAARLGCSRSAVSTWETRHGLPRPQRLADLARLLGVAVSELIEDPTEIQVLKRSRLCAGLRQRDVASLLHVTVSTYADVENGRQKIPPRWIPTLAKIFHTTEGAIPTRG